mgnify:CR=1 FL=1
MDSLYCCGGSSLLVGVWREKQGLKEVSPRTALGPLHKISPKLKGVKVAKIYQ